MADPPRTLLIVFGVQVRPVFHSPLREIEHVSCRVMRADPCERPVSGPLQDPHFRIFLFQSVENEVDVFHLKSEVIKAGLSSWSARIQIKTYVAVAHDDGSP